MSEQTYVIKFEGAAVADANRYADELRNALLDSSPDVQVTIQRDDPTTMDFGGTLILILGTPAILAIARGIANWLQRRNSASITIETPNGGRIVANHISGGDARKLADSLLAQG